MARLTGSRVPCTVQRGKCFLQTRPPIISCWSEHFQSLFSMGCIVQDSAVLLIPQQPFKAELDELPSMKEITKAIEQLRNGKAAGVDGIPPEFWKEGGPALHNKPHKLLVCCWEQGKLPSDLCDAVIVTFYKNKGEKSDCSKYWGITLLSIARKIFACVLLNRLVPTIAEDHLPEIQCGFRANRSTTDMVFILRQLQEKCRKLNKGLYIGVCGPDQSVLHSEQKGTVDDNGASWLPHWGPQHSYPTAQRPVWPS